MALKKELNLLHVFAIASGSMISSGLFVLPGIAYAKTGPAMILSYIIAGLLIIPSMLAKAELSTAMPKAGGTYFFIERSLGPAMGTFGGFANWFSLSLKGAFALVGIGAFMVLIKPDISPAQIKMIAIVACIFFTVFNLISVKFTGLIQNFLVIILIVVLLFYIGKGFISTIPEHYVPFMPMGWQSIFSTAGLVFISFGGLTKVASIAEEVHNPSKNIPLGMFLAFFIVTMIYVLSIGVTVGIMNPAELGGSLVPLSLGAFHLMGKGGMIILSIAAMIAFITTANAGILSASRFPMAMSRDRLLPPFFEKTNPRFHTPYFSIFLTSFFMIIVILFLGIEELVKTASTLMIILFMMDNISVIIMRESKIQNYRPTFRVPLYPWLPLAALLTYGFLLIEMGKIPLLITGGFFTMGWIVYWGYSRMRVHRKSALLHIVKRITAKELVSETLQKELRDIVIERDDICEDRFDQLIKKCDILDIIESKPLKSVFQEVSSILSQRLNIDQSILYDGFLKREKQSGTVVRPGLAIPHVIVPGDKKFEVLLVRCRPGLLFSNVSDPVHTMFVLVGSIDERNYHLRALMAIAQIAQEQDFETKWLSANNIEELRDVILLSNRQRDCA